MVTSPNEWKTHEWDEKLQTNKQKKNTYCSLSFVDNYIPFCFLKGNHRIYEIVQQGFYELRIDLADLNNVRKHALYKRFYIGDENSGYILHVQNYEGTAGIY